MQLATCCTRRPTCLAVNASWGCDTPHVLPPCAARRSLSDPSGDSAIVEWIAGALRVWHGRQWTILVNFPNYQQHLDYLSYWRDTQQWAMVPGSTSSLDRFARLAWTAEQLVRGEGMRCWLLVLLPAHPTGSSGSTSQLSCLPACPPCAGRVQPDRRQLPGSPGPDCHAARALAMAAAPCHCAGDHVADFVAQAGLARRRGHGASARMCRVACAAAAARLASIY